MGIFLYLDTILVPLSIFLTLGYHAYLWHKFNNKPSLTTHGLNLLHRRLWLQEIDQGDDKKCMLAVQSLRNKLMDTILTATITVIIIISLGALMNNTYHANHVFAGGFFGSQSGKILVVKYGSALIFLLFSFICSSMGLANLIDANFLINAMGEFSSSPKYTEKILERGFLLAVIGNRVLCMSIPVLMWMLGPVPVALSSAALVWGLFGLDFVGDSVVKANNNKSLPTELTDRNCH